MWGIGLPYQPGESLKTRRWTAGSSHRCLGALVSYGVSSQVDDIGARVSHPFYNQFQRVRSPGKMTSIRQPLQQLDCPQFHCFQQHRSCLSFQRWQVFVITVSFSKLKSLPRRTFSPAAFSVIFSSNVVIIIIIIIIIFFIIVPIIIFLLRLHWADTPYLPQLFPPPPPSPPPSSIIQGQQFLQPLHVKDSSALGFSLSPLLLSSTARRARRPPGMPARRSSRSQRSASVWSHRSVKRNMPGCAAALGFSRWDTRLAQWWWRCHSLVDTGTWSGMRPGGRDVAAAVVAAAAGSFLFCSSLPRRFCKTSVQTRAHLRRRGTLFFFPADFLSVVLGVVILFFFPSPSFSTLKSITCDGDGWL